MKLIRKIELLWHASRDCSHAPDLIGIDLNIYNIQVNSSGEKIDIKLFNSNSLPEDLCGECSDKIKNRELKEF